MLRKKLCDYESLLMSSEWHPLLMVLFYCDSTGAITQAKKSKFHQCIKHILYCYHLIQKIIDQDDVDLQKINEKENLADPFTKTLKIKEFDDHKSKMDIRYCTD